ncbi:tail fiber domain-containing protein [Halobacteriovorax sp. GB3]|uniref:tail fiber domain-containing protein n=1 Tax=Halobacteriovorax sp. GB3 TaxID=2719615 RepID=UPI0023603BF5|nr:tail fiber domain-containing protein [Halobacteriovorax sp. GB3]MDD0854358.1 tail fiber domain-containing protein [Halobacteriovorax sp. GB3]
MKFFTRKEKKKSMNEGFSLVEIMVAAGLVGVVSLAVVNLVSNLNKTQKRAQQVFSVEQEISRISSVLNDKDSCEATFATQTFGGGYDATTELAINDISQVTNAGTNTIYSINDELGDGGGLVVLKDMRLVGVKNESTPFLKDGDMVVQAETEFRVFFRKGRDAVDDNAIVKSSHGAVEIRRVFNLSVVVNQATGEIVSCYGAIDSYTAATCSSLGGNIDNDGNCVEVHIKTGVGGAGTGNKMSAILGSTTASNISGGGYARAPLKVTLADDENGAGLLFDDNQVQAVNAANNPTIFYLNEDGGDIELGNVADKTIIKGAVEAETTMQVTGATTLQNILTVTGTSTFNGQVLLNQNTTLANSRTLTITSNAMINYTSDKRLKDKIKEIESPLKKIDQIRGVEYVWRKTGTKDVGYIAQEVQKILPELVHTDKEGTLSVQYAKMSAFNTAAIKELKEENEKLKDDLSLLKKVLCSENPTKFKSICK